MCFIQQSTARNRFLAGVITIAAAVTTAGCGDSGSVEIPENPIPLPGSPQAVEYPEDNAPVSPADIGTGDIGTGDGGTVDESRSADSP